MIAVWVFNAFDNRVAPNSFGKLVAFGFKFFTNFFPRHLIPFVAFFFGYAISAPANVNITVFKPFVLLFQFLYFILKVLDAAVKQLVYLFSC